MVLTNNWFALLWIPIIGLAMHIMIPQKRVRINGKIEYRWEMWMAILAIIPYVVWAGYRIDTGDTGVYRKLFLSAPATLSQIPEYLSNNTKDKGFSVLVILIKSIIGNSDVMFFLLIAIFQMVCLVMVYRKYSTNYLFSIFLFVASTDYFSWMFNGIRQFIAAAGIFACTTLMLKKKYFPVVLIILALSTIHGSALIMLPIVFVAQGKAWNKKTVLLIIAIVLATAFVGQFTPILDTLMAETQYSDILTNEIWLNDDGTNIIRVIVYSVPTLLSLVGKKFIDNENNPVVNLSVNMSICAAAFYLLSSVTSGIYVGRIPIYMSLYSYISLPWLLKNIFTDKSMKIMYVFTIVLYLLFFYYQMFVIW